MGLIEEQGQSAERVSEELLRKKSDKSSETFYNVL